MHHAQLLPLIERFNVLKDTMFIVTGSCRCNRGILCQRECTCCYRLQDIPVNYNIKPKGSEVLAHHVRLLVAELVHGPATLHGIRAGLTAGADLLTHVPPAGAL